MKSHARLGGKYLMGAVLTGAVLYLVTTATVHGPPLWPYLVLLGTFIAGGILYLAGQERPAATTGPVDHDIEQAAADPAPDRATAVVTNRWRLTTDGAGTRPDAAQEQLHVSPRLREPVSHRESAAVHADRGCGAL